MGDEIRSATLVLNPSLRLRREHFGSLAWEPGRLGIVRLDPACTAVALFHLYPRTVGEAPSTDAESDERALISPERFLAICKVLIRESVLVDTSETSTVRNSGADLESVGRYLRDSLPTRSVAKPFWVHIQPFTFCNQQCVHCYCDGSPNARQFQLPIKAWMEIIAKLDDYGIMDIYVTGGETMILDEFFILAQEIRRRKLGFGISTNAMVVRESTLARISELRLSPLQVSLDGALASTHDAMRGTDGAFRRTMAGIDRLQTVADVVINTVVNKHNMEELAGIVALGVSKGIVHFKFFPQKAAGRGSEHPEILLTDDEIGSVLIPECLELANRFGVRIETLDPHTACGSGRSGFAINEVGDVYPCIFGVMNARIRCGNILTDEVDHLWFESSIMNEFRKKSDGFCHRCE